MGEFSFKKKKSLIIAVIIFFVIILLYLINPKFLGISKNYKPVYTDDFQVITVADGFAELPPENEHIINNNTYYSYAYSEKLCNSYWVSYILTKKMVLTKNANRQNERFVKDPQLVDNYAVTSDYKNTGYDRGHLCPAADMNFNQTAMSESFYLSNISPQNPNFNRSIWAELENKVRDWAVQNDSLYVVAGAIFSDNPKKISNKIAVPTYFYKVVTDISAQDGYKAIAFVFENKEYQENDDCMTYAITINELEEITEIDFFANYKSPDVELIEASINKHLWK